MRGNALFWAGHLTGWPGGDLEAARPLLEESLAIARELADQRLLGDVLRHRGNIALQQGDLETARPLIEESLAADRDAGNERGILAGLVGIGGIARAHGANGKAA